MFSIQGTLCTRYTVYIVQCLVYKLHRCVQCLLFKVCTELCTIFIVKTNTAMHNIWRKMYTFIEYNMESGLVKIIFLKCVEY